MRTIKEHIRIFRRPALLGLGFLVALTVSRLVLMGLHWDRVEVTGGSALILLQGLRFDLVLVGLVFGPAFLFIPWLQAMDAMRKIGAWLLAAWLGMATALAVFIEASSAPFIKQFDARPNYLFVEYLKYPREVLVTLTGTHLAELIATTVIAVLAGALAARWLLRDPGNRLQVSWRFCLLATPVVLVAATLMIRSTLDHRPVNPSMAAFSQDAMVNQLPLNSPYAVIYAVYEKNRDAAFHQGRYGVLDEDKAMRIIQREAGIRPNQVLDPTAPTLRLQRATQPRVKPLNLVIVLEESLGAEFVGSLGGKDLTPELDRLADEGIWFKRLYATGIRSARGLEAVLSGFTPTPLQSVIKLTETQDNFFTLASLLGRHGYATSFLYGGEAHFDNMRRFFLNNGFDTVIDEGDFETPVFHGSWGVSDEDILMRAHDSFMAAGDEPFFSLVFTTSNHEPYDIPAGRVTPSEYGPRETTIKYADWALGRFVDAARGAAYWEDTVILIIADHNARIYGGRLVPVERFRIPGVIIGGSIEPRRVTGITSQIDMLPTLLSLIGLNAEHPAIGRDLTLPEYTDGAGRAMMQFHANQAYIEDDWIIVLRPDQRIRTFRAGPQFERIRDSSAPNALKNRALAYAMFGPRMIREGAYRH